MLTAKPLQVFNLGPKRVLVCHIQTDNPARFLNREFSFYANGLRAGRIRIEGVSTASPNSDLIFDFSYTGDEIRPEQLGDRSLITDGRYEDALRELAAA